jgi:hypothetical protein
MWWILRQAGADPAPERTTATWAGFLRSPAEALLACGFSGTVTLTGARLYVLAVIEHGTRRIRVLGATPHPGASWVAQAAKNLVMDLEVAVPARGSCSRTATANSPACLTPCSRTPGSRPS